MSRPPYDAEMLSWIAVRDQFRCHICGQAFRPLDPWHVDHVIPYAIEGRHRLSNMRLAHASCNLAKAAS